MRPNPEGWSHPNPNHTICSQQNQTSALSCTVSFILQTRCIKKDNRERLREHRQRETAQWLGQWTAIQGNCHWGGRDITWTTIYEDKHCSEHNCWANFTTQAWRQDEPLAKVLTLPLLKAQELVYASFSIWPSPGLHSFSQKLLKLPQGTGSRCFVRMPLCNLTYKLSCWSLQSTEVCLVKLFLMFKKLWCLNIYLVSQFNSLFHLLLT